MSEAFGELRELLHRQPNVSSWKREKNWAAICAHINGMDPGQQREAVDYAVGLAESWPRTLRRAREEWFATGHRHEMQSWDDAEYFNMTGIREQPATCWPLVRTLPWDERHNGERGLPQLFCASAPLRAPIERLEYELPSFMFPDYELSDVLAAEFGTFLEGLSLVELCLQHGMGVDHLERLSAIDLGQISAFEWHGPNFDAQFIEQSRAQLFGLQSLWSGLRRLEISSSIWPSDVLIDWISLRALNELQSLRLFLVLHAVLEASAIERWLATAPYWGSLRRLELGSFTLGEGAVELLFGSRALAGLRRLCFTSIRSPASVGSSIGELRWLDDWLLEAMIDNGIAAQLEFLWVDGLDLSEQGWALLEDEASFPCLETLKFTRESSERPEALQRLAQNPRLAQICQDTLQLHLR